MAQVESTMAMDASGEPARLAALQELDLLDTPASESYDRITRMASRLFNVPVAAVSLTDIDRQWFKSTIGVGDLRQLPRKQAPCSIIAETTAVLVVPDMLEDARFIGSPLTESGMRFYAGAPLVTREGFGLGSMCVLDAKPRFTTPEEVQSLQDFAAMVMAQIELQHRFGRLEPLSGLPNRHQLAEDLGDMARDAPGAARVSVLVDVSSDRQFHQTISALGFGFLDDLVRSSSKIVRDVFGRGTKLYQVGAAAYVAILEDRLDQPWRDIVAALAARLQEPVWCNGVPVTMNAVFGIAPFRLGAASTRDVLRTASSAAQDAREAGQEYAVYSAANDQANHRRFTLLTDMRGALAQPDGLALAYQPRLDIRSGVCHNAEALLRWQHPTLGPISPGEFIPLVEQTALATPLTDWVVESSFAQAAAWKRAGHPLGISINVAASNVADPGFSRRIEAALKRHGIAATDVELELTEGALIDNGTTVLTQLRDLRAMGFTIAIDDFGTGYSSFAYLQRIPASVVKLDQSFMKGLAGQERDRVLVRSMIGMAHDLGYRVVAEGVETAEMLEILTNAGCDEAQGYYVSRPLLPDALAAWFAGAGQVRQAVPGPGMPAAA